MFDLEVAKQNGAVVELLENRGEFKARFPYFCFEEFHACVTEQEGAGYGEIATRMCW